MLMANRATVAPVRQQTQPREDSFGKSDKKVMIKSAAQHYEHYEQHQHQEKPYTYTASIVEQQQQQQQQPMAKPIGRLEKAKQLARKINDTNNYDRMSTQSSSISPASSYASSFSPVSFPNSTSTSSSSSSYFDRLPNNNSNTNSAHSSALNSPTANSDSSSSSTRFNFPSTSPQQQNSSSSSTVNPDSVASLLPLYITQYLTTLQALNVNSNGNQFAQSSLNTNDYLQSLTNAIFALSSVGMQQKQQSIVPVKPAEKRSFTGVPKSQQQQQQHTPAIKPPTATVKYPTIVIEDKENALRQVEEHFKRSLGADYNKLAAQKSKFINRYESAGHGSSTSSTSSSSAVAKKLKKSHSHVDLVIDESSDCEQLNQEDNCSERTASRYDEYSENDSISSMDDNDDEDASSSCFNGQKRSGGVNFVDSHFSKALGQSVWSTLKAKATTDEANSTGGSPTSSLNQSFED
jgi:hypothetical protein